MQDLGQNKFYSGKLELKSELHLEPEVKRGISNFRKLFKWNYEIAYGSILGPEALYCEEEVGSEVEQYYQSFVNNLFQTIKPVSLEKINETIKRSDLVYVSDFHPLRVAKNGFISLIEENEDSQTVIMLEAFKTKKQKHLDSYLRGEIGNDQLKKVFNDNGEGKYSWQGLSLILEYARERKIPVYGIDTKNSLWERDKSWAKKHQQVLGDNPNSKIFTLVGELHLARDHLPAELLEVIPDIKSTTIYQGLTEIFWEMLEKGMDAHSEAVEINEDTFCLNNCSPLLKALVYERNVDLDDVSGTEIDRVYKSMLGEIIEESLGLNVGDNDLNPVNIIDLEYIAHSDLGDDEVLQMYEQLFSEN